MKKPAWYQVEGEGCDVNLKPAWEPCSVSYRTIGAARIELGDQRLIQPWKKFRIAKYARVRVVREVE